MNASEQTPDFAAVKNRLAEIAEAVDDESLSLDDALDLYEEAVSLGLKASDLLEVGVGLPEEEAAAEVELEAAQASGDPSAAGGKPAE